MTDLVHVVHVPVHVKTPFKPALVLTGPRGPRDSHLALHVRARAQGGRVPAFHVDHVDQKGLARLSEGPAHGPHVDQDVDRGAVAGPSSGFQDADGEAAIAVQTVVLKLT